MRAPRKAVSGEVRHGLEPARLRGDYERLRGDAVAAGAGGWRWGRSVLERAGIAAWMRVWSDHCRAGLELGVNRPPAHANRGAAQLGAWDAASSSRLPVESCDAGALPVDADAIVRLLAQLVRGVLAATPAPGAPGVGVSA